MNPQTPAQRKAQERKRKRAEGFALVQVWVPERDKDKLRKYAAELCREGGK